MSTVDSPVGGRDRVLIGAGIGCVLLSVVGIVMDLADLAPSVVAVLVVVVPLGIALQVLLRWAARSASPARRAKVLLIVSWGGLAVAGVTVLAAIPSLTEAGGADVFLGDLGAHLWPLLWLTVAAGLVRTLTGRVFVGMLFAGFLGIPALATLVGEPIMDWLGDRPLTVSVVLPFTEEVVKVLPVVLVVVLAVRRTASRPSAVDVMLLGAWVGAGFGLYENALYGRGGMGEVPPLSLLLPTVGTGEVNGFAMLAAGHLVWSGLIGLGIGIGVLYRRLAWFALPVAFAVAFGEHAVVNAIAGTDDESLSPLVGFLRVPLLFGWLSSLLLLGGSAAVVVFEWRRVRSRGWRALWVNRAESARRGELLAAAQTGVNA